MQVATIENQMYKVLKGEGEQAKVAVRNIRRDAIGQMKDLTKAKEISEDDERRGEDQAQKITDEHVKQIDELVSAKEQEMLEKKKRMEAKRKRERAAQERKEAEQKMLAEQAKIEAQERASARRTGGQSGEHLGRL